MNVHPISRPSADIEFHTDSPASAEEIAVAFDAMLPVADGDRTAAAILAVGAVLADAMRQLGHGRAAP